LDLNLDEAANTLYTELNSTTNGILAFANNPQSQFFTETISSWTFPPIAPYLIIFPSVEEEETPGSNPQDGQYLVINNGDAMPTSGWNVGGSKPFSFVIYDGDAIIKQGNTTVWSFSSVYFQLYPLDEAQIENGAISVTGVKFENGQLVFSLSGGTRAQVALGMDNNQYPDDTRNKFTSAIFQSDGSFAAFIPYTYKDLNGNTRQGIPWTNQQMSLFTEEVFNALSMTTEGKQTADALTKTLDYLGVLSTGDKTNINIQDLGDLINQWLSKYAQQVQSIINSTGGLYLNKLQPGYALLNLGDATQMIDLGNTSLQFYQLYAQAVTILSSASQAIVYAYYFKPDLLKAYGIDISSLSEDFTDALQTLNNTFTQGLTSFQVNSYVGGITATSASVGKISFNTIPGTKQRIQAFTNSDTAPMIYVPFTMQHQLSHTDIENYIKLVKSRNLAALTQNADPAFVCALTGNFYQTSGELFNCASQFPSSNYPYQTVGVMAQYSVVSSAFSLLPPSSADGEFGSNFANITLQFTRQDGSGNTQYIYAIVSRFEANTAVPSENNKTYWDAIVTDNFVVNDNLFDGYLQDVSPINTDLPRGNWPQFCKIPEVFNPQTGSGCTKQQDNSYVCNASAYSSVTSPLELQCSINPSASVPAFQKYTIYPASCVSTNFSDVSLHDVFINFNPTTAMLTCSVNSFDYQSILDNGLKFSPASSIDPKTLVISNDGQFIGATAMKGNHDIVQTWPLYRLDVIHNYGIDFNGMYRNASEVTVNNGNSGNTLSSSAFSINKAGYLWSPSPSDLWPDSM
jgi:hypothetical protein